MMVLFRGYPCPTAASSLRQAGVAIGLALSSGELPAVRGLDEYSYVFVSVRSRGRSTLAEAVADLKGNSWSVDDDPVEAADRPRPGPSLMVRPQTQPDRMLSP
jgi:hypothetical protein